jgi:hypothetical protein
MMEVAYEFVGFVIRGGRTKEPARIHVSAPEPTQDHFFRCDITTNLFSTSPHRVYSALAHDAWSAAFEVLRHELQRTHSVLLNEQDAHVDLPSPPRDRSWVPPPRVPNVEGIEPIYRTRGWATSSAGEKQSVELAIWPPFEEEPGTFCAPMRSGLMNGQVRCSYGVSPEQAVHLAYKYLQVEIEHRRIADDIGRLIEVPITPEPPLPED